MIPKLIFVVAVVTAVFVFIVWGGHPASHCNVVHAFKGKCPEGYIRESEPRFTEQNGSKEFACVSTDPILEQCVDVLRPGETVTFGVEMEFEEPEPASPEKKL